MSKINNNYVSTELLYNLFMKQKIRQVYKYVPQTPPKILPTTPTTPSQYPPTSPPRKTIQTTFLTPMSKMIVQAARTPMRSRLIEELKKDDTLIRDLEILQDEDDPDYLEKMLHNNLGFYMEDFLSYYATCPICGKNTLRKYSIKNMPVVDLVCINKEEHIKKDPPNCFLFQVKIKVDGSKYFNYDDHYISVGSKLKGYNAHEVYGGQGLKDKLIIVSYICLHMRTIDDNTYRIDRNSSFMIIPKYTESDFPSEKFYQYIDENDPEYPGQVSRFSKNVIRWSTHLNDAYDIDTLLDTNHRRVDTNEQFYDYPIDNPYDDVPDIILK